MNTDQKINNEDLRKIVILFILNLINKPVFGRTYLQKLFYLFEKEFEKEKESKDGLHIFNYEAHFYGPFSRELNIMLTKLSSEHYIEENKSGECYVYRISDKGKNFLEKNKNTLNPKLINKITKLVEYFKDFSATELLNFVYKRFPQDTSRSIYWTTKEKNFLY